jgi:broad specificity phosphatase PhoE
MPVAPLSGHPRLLLVRHGATSSHRGDVPLSHQGRQQAERFGRRIAALGLGGVRVLTGSTQRTRQTGLLLVHGLTSIDPSAAVTGPRVSFALRNPDLYLAGERVDMVSSAAAFLEQAPGVTEADLAALPFYARFLDSPDRIGWWLHHEHPPGDDAAAVTARMVAFAASLGDTGGHRDQDDHAGQGGQGGHGPDTVLGVTHSPVLRALALRLLGSDPGEPDHLSGFALHLDAAGDAHLEAFDPA